MKKTLLFVLLLFVIGAFLGWARFISTKGLRIKEYAFINTNLPEQFVGKKIVHFSDLHYGSTIFEKELINLVDTINDQKPDLIIFTGDLVAENYTMNEKERLIIIKELSRLDATIGKYAVKGNHDYEQKNFENMMEQSNFILLKNNFEYIYFENETPMIIAGLSSLLKEKQDLSQTFSFLEKEEEKRCFTLVIVHEPDTLKAIRKYDVDLMLSGHSHGGQVRFPFLKALITQKGAKIYNEEQYLVDETNLYVSSGIGTSIFKIRFLNKPSINLFRLYNK